MRVRGEIATTPQRSGHPNRLLVQVNNAVKL